MTRRKRLSRKEQKAAAKEIAARKKALDLESKQRKKSLKAQLQESDELLSKEAKAATKRRRRAKDVYNAIGFEMMYEDGVCEVEKGLYSQCMSFSDISYQSARLEDQKAYFNMYSQVFDYCGSDTALQMNIINTPLSESQIGNRKFFPDTDDPTSEKYIKEYNSILNRKMMEGISNIERERYLTFSVAADSYEAALPKLSRMFNDISSAFVKLGCSVHKLDGRERLEVINSQSRPCKDFTFEYEDLYLSGLTTKDYVCPQVLDFKPEGMNSVFKSDDKWGQVLVFRKFGSQLTDYAISDIIDLPIPLNITLHIQPMDKGASSDFVMEKLAYIDKEIIEEQKKAVRKGFDYQLISQELSFSKNDAEELLHELLYQNQRLFIFTGLIFTYADTEEQLREQAVRIISTARRASIEIDVLECQQKLGLNSILPLGHNHVEVSRYFTTAQTAMLMPFATQELAQKGGGYYGQNKLSNNLILMNRKKLAAPMGFVLGTPGSGKSFAVKREITNSFLANPNDEFIIFDPQNEYPYLVEALGGEVINLSPSSEDHINVFDIYEGAYDVTKEDPTLFKSETILAIAAVVMGKADGQLSPEERTIIDRCVRTVYAEVKVRMPVLSDFYEVLKKQPEAEAQRLVTAFELYVEGGLNYFNNQTSKTLTKRITSVSFKKLGDNMRLFAMLVLADWAYNRMLYNFERGVTTWLYIDEVQTFFTIPAVVAYFDSFWAEGRKFNLIPTGITQLVERIIEHPVAKLMLSNSDYLLLLRQSDRDRRILSTNIGLSPQQEEYIGRANDVGEGLLIAGSAIIPFRDKWPKGELYDLWNTKPDEIAEKKRAAWANRTQGASAREYSPNTEAPGVKAAEEKVCSLCGNTFVGDGTLCPTCSEFVGEIA